MVRPRLFWASVALNAVLLVVLAVDVHKRGGLQFLAALADNRPTVSLYDLKRDIQTTHRGDIVLLGDSIFDLMEANEYFTVPVINRGITGDTTAGVLNRLPEILAGKPKTIVLLVGINDIRLGAGAEEVIANYRLIREAVPKVVRLLVLPILPVNEPKYAQNIILTNPKSAMPSRIKVETVNAFLRTQPDFIPLPVLSNGQLADEYSLDGLHLNAKGLEVLAREVTARL